MAADVHHRIPCCLLRLRDRLDAHTEIDQEGWGLWEDYHEECWRYGVDPDASRDRLAALVEASTVEVVGEDHRTGHSAADDFARWGRLGGLETLRRYGRPWYSLLGRRRWEQVGVEALASYQAELLTAKTGGGHQAAPLFPMGRIVATPDALNALAKAGQDPSDLLRRHQAGDWGDVPCVDAEENRRSVRYGWRILSSYPVGSSRVWILTEADGSGTCLLLPEEY